MAGAADKKDEGKAPETDIDASSTPPEGYTAEEWEGLSVTERDGIKDSIDNPEVGGEEDVTKPDLDEKALAAIAAEGERPPEKKEADGAPAKPPAAVPAASEAAAPATVTEGAAADPAAATPPATPPGEATEATEVASDEELLSFRPVVSDADLPMPDTVPPEIQAKLEALDSKYDAGDIPLPEYNKERDALNRQVFAANVQTRDAARSQKTWDLEQAAFLRARPEYLEKGADGKFTEKSELLYGAFGKAVNRIGADPKFANAHGMALLVAADKAVRSTFRMPAPGKKATPAAAQKKDEGKPPTPPPNVQTLGKVPTAAPNSTDDGFAAIDKLTGEAYEAALERMTQEQRDAYAARA